MSKQAYDKIVEGLNEALAVTHSKLNWGSAMYSKGQVQTADLHLEGKSYRYVVRRLKPHSREWVARRDNEDFVHKSFASIEGAMAHCERDSHNPSSWIDLAKLKSKAELRALQES